MRFNRKWLGNLGNMLIGLGSFLGIIVLIAIIMLIIYGIEIPVGQAVLRMLLLITIPVMLIWSGVCLRKKFYQAVSKSRDVKIRADSRVYTCVLKVLGFLSLYVCTGALAISQSAGHIAEGYLLTQIPLFVTWIVMLYFRIRYLYINRITPKPIQRMKHFWVAFKCFLRPLPLKFRETEENNEVALKLSSFQEEFSDFYNGKKISKNVTQMYQHLLFLHKKRLDRLKLKRNISFQRMKLEDVPTVRGTRVKDGKLSHIHAQEYLIEQQSYTMNHKTVYATKKNVCADYDLIGAEGRGAEAGKQLFLCPNCGGTANAEELMTGCPFCGTKFLIEELGHRICGFSMFQEYELNKKLAMYRIDTVINWIVFCMLILLSIGFYGLFYDVFVKSDALLVELPFAIVISITTLLMSFAVFMGVGYLLSVLLRVVVHFLYQKLYMQRTEIARIYKKNQEMARKLQYTMPEFSMNSFFSNVRNKVAAIHFCETKQHLQVYTTGDLSDYAVKYADVVDCMFGPMELNEMNTDGNVQRAKVFVKVKMLQWDGKKFREEEEKLKIDLMHISGYKSNNPYGVYSPKCLHCGSSVDLLKGNECEYCGTELNVTHLDWCITAYSKV